MIARGDLGVEIGDAELPAAQKLLIERARERDTVVITATQMMESMISSPLPTRAEVFDVANAVMMVPMQSCYREKPQLGAMPHMWLQQWRVFVKALKNKEE